MITITPTQLRKAADIQEQIQSLQQELNDILGGGEISTPAQATEPSTEPKKQGMSAAGRAAVSAAAKARWAKVKDTTPTMEPAQKPKKKLSARGIANIRAGVAKRMAAQGKAQWKAVDKPKMKSKMTAVGLANIRAAQKARWAKKIR